MSDNLEKFVRKNREHFDSETPRDKVWSNIYTEIRPEKTIRRISWYKYAAAALILVSFGAGIGLFIGNSHSNSEILVQQQIEESEKKYTKLVNNKLNELSEYDFDKKLLTDIELLDQIHLELKAELIENSGANSRVVIHAMMQNYQAKLAALERILSEVKENDLETQSKESSTIY